MEKIYPKNCNTYDFDIEEVKEINVWCLELPINMIDKAIQNDPKQWIEKILDDNGQFHKTAGNEIELPIAGIQRVMAFKDTKISHYDLMIYDTLPIVAANNGGRVFENIQTGHIYFALPSNIMVKDFVATVYETLEKTKEWNS